MVASIKTQDKKQEKDLGTHALFSCFHWSDVREHHNLAAAIPPLTWASADGRVA